MTRSIFRAVFGIALLLGSVNAASAQARSLDIYWVDVEGGAATLVISPTGESLLFDAGWEERDAKRIADVAHQAGLQKIDYFILSHYHPDHAGGVPALGKLIPISKCFDRGLAFIEPTNKQWLDAYLSVCGDKRTAVNPGDKIPLAGLQVDIVASNGNLIAQSASGLQANPLCATAENHPKEGPENQLMVGALFTYGKFRFLDLADLDWEKEMEFACPMNRLGQVTIWQANRHGSLDGAGAPGLLYAIRPQVVVVNNGPRKGLGVPPAGATKPLTNHYERIARTPGIEGLWQVHLSLLDREHNTPADMIANLDEGELDKANWIKASVAADGTLTMTNGRNNVRKAYKPR